MRSPTYSTQGRRRAGAEVCEHDDGDDMITIFGSTGGTGRELVRLALEQGHDVTAVARDPDAVEVAHERLVVLRADVLDPGSLPAVMGGAGAVMSALGAAAGRAPTTVYSAGVANILEAMCGADVRRFIGISAAPVIPRSEAGVAERLLVFPLLYRFFGGAYADMWRMEGLLRASQAEWTVLRPPMLTDKPPTGRYRTALNENVRGGRRITRGDLAAAMLEVLDDRSAVRAAVGVAN
ncbi:MAG: SDR family oxidoreductase [Actinomycetota bacterium]|nr:SDR family oxidoreductase [Actinomycetota bacterium]